MSARLSRTSIGLSDADRAALTESIELAERSTSGIRTLSYLLHPPFGGITVDLDLPPDVQ